MAWIVTCEVNDYNQYGEYLIAVFSLKPTFQQLKELLDLDDVTIGKLTRGGGRQSHEDTWYYLREILEGQRFKGTKV